MCEEPERRQVGRDGPRGCLGPGGLGLGRGGWELQDTGPCAVFVCTFLLLMINPACLHWVRKLRCKRVA